MASANTFVNSDSGERYFTFKGRAFYEMTSAVSLAPDTPVFLNISTFDPADQQIGSSVFVDPSTGVLGFTEPGNYSIKVVLAVDTPSSTPSVTSLAASLQLVTSGPFTGFILDSVQQFVPILGATSRATLSLSCVSFFAALEGVRVQIVGKGAVTGFIVNSGTCSLTITRIN